MKINNYDKQQGQTLIETMVASLVLVMGISAAVGLAVYGLGATGTISKQLIGVGLAREGIEAVKNMRDTNWLTDTLSTDCYDFYTDNPDGANCYKNWRGSSYAISPGTYRLMFSAGSPENNYWELRSTESDFGFQYNESFNGSGFYEANGRDDSDFRRMITITEETPLSAFQDSELGPRLKVTVDVWWKDKRCPDSSTPPDLKSCKVTLETYLTNWKNY